MGALDENSLLKQIREKKFDRLYLLYGTEDYLKQHYASLIPKKTVKPDFETFNLHILDGNGISLDEIADCINALPMMGEYSCTVVRDLNIAELVSEKASKEQEPQLDAQDGKGQKFQDLIEIISDIPETSILIFWLDGVQVDMKNSKWIKVIKTFEKYGSAVNLSSRSLSALAKLLCDSAAKKGCALDRADASYMISIAGDDMGTLRNELDKLCLYKTDGKITRADIDKCVIFSAQAKIFSLAKAIIAGRADEAFEILGLLIKQREEPFVILAVLSGAYIDMYRVKAAIQSGLRAPAVADCFAGYKNKMFAIENAASSSKKYSLEQLRQAIFLLSNADTEMKSTRADRKTVLEFLILNLLRI